MIWREIVKGKTTKQKFGGNLLRRLVKIKKWKKIASGNNDKITFKIYTCEKEEDKIAITIYIFLVVFY